MLIQPKLACVLFDESHSEAWTIRPELAAEIQPAHPADSSLAAAAEALASRDYAVETGYDHGSPAIAARRRSRRSSVSEMLSHSLQRSQSIQTYSTASAPS